MACWRVGDEGVCEKTDLPALKEIKLKEQCFYSADNTFLPAELVMKSESCRED